MTKQEALQELMDLSIDYGTRTAEEIERLDEAVDMAIAALREDAVDRQTCEDAVSRRAALDAVLDVIPNDEYWMEQVNKAIFSLPSVQPLVIHCTDCEDWLERQSILGFTISELPSVQPQTEEDCDTCKHGFFGSRQCDNCRVRYPSHYEREEEEQHA